MEFTILYGIVRTAFLDNFFLIVTRLTGSIGQLWLIAGLALLIFKKTRKAGAAVLISYFGVLIFGELLLKHLVVRPRPCQIDQVFSMLVDRPTSSSFPSTHAAWSFGVATAIFMYYRKTGIAVFIVAALIAFSRLYMFLHFPTDVLAGIVLGIILGIVSFKLTSRFAKSRAAAETE